MLVVLDSTVLIDFLRGRPAVDRVRALRARGDVPATTVINVAEIVRGLPASETDAARRLLTGLEVLTPSLDAAWQARGVTTDACRVLIADLAAAPAFNAGA